MERALFGDRIQRCGHQLDHGVRLIAQAVAPWLTALVLEDAGVGDTLAALTVAALLNVGLALGLWRAVSHRGATGERRAA